MEARIGCCALILACIASLGANYRTTNFLVSAPTAELAREVGDAAEKYREDLATKWLGHALPQWPQPCPISVVVGQDLGAGGATSFMFDQRRPFGWKMDVQGSRERILDSVLPHEISHTVFATHFGRPLPRWADEGACTTVEHVSERRKQHHLLVQFLTSGRGIPFHHMFAMREYPEDVLPLYAQGYALTRYLIEQGGPRKFVQYVGDGMDRNDWVGATQRHYGFDDLSELQLAWRDWIKDGCPTLVAKNTPVTPAVASTRSSVSVSPVSLTSTEHGEKLASLANNAQDSAGSFYVRSGRKGPSSSRYAPDEVPREILLEWSRNTGPADYAAEKNSLVR